MGEETRASASLPENWSEIAKDKRESPGPAPRSGTDPRPVCGNEQAALGGGLPGRGGPAKLGGAEYIMALNKLSSMIYSPPPLVWLSSDQCSLHPAQT